MDDNDGVRNRIVHGYPDIDDSILFTTIERDLKPLLPHFEAPTMTVRHTAAFTRSLGAQASHAATAIRCYRQRR
jgi:hypothetical protein